MTSATRFTATGCGSPTSRSSMRVSGAVVGREALLRWRHPTRGEIPPDLFVPIIEDAGLIHQIGDWVIREACTEAASWHRALTVAVNVSAAQLSGAGLAQTVLGALAASGLDPARLELEVTESVFLGDDAATLAIARAAARARRAAWCSTISARAIRRSAI